MKVQKILSANDIGRTGSHQSGLHVPKASPLVDLLPRHRWRERNPRIAIDLFCPDVDVRVIAQLIYYNNALEGGTRDEFRLTHLTQLFRRLGVEEGDCIEFEFDSGASATVRLVRVSADLNESEPLVWRGGWKVIGG